MPVAAPDQHLYLDYAASAPIRPEALEAMAVYDASPYAGANPNSLHTMGRQAARALDGARRDLARCLGGGFRPSDVTFTSGGTEGDNLALFGLSEAMRAKDRRRTRVVISAIEHDAVISCAPSLRDRGFEVTVVRPGRDGVVTAEAISATLDRDVALVSVMYANNETGVVQPIPAIAKEAHGAGAVMHTDAVQAFCRIPLELSDVDAVTVTAHKIGGPVGTGALAVRGRVQIRPQVFGGGQELGRRPGTQDVRGTLAFAAVATACNARIADSRAATSGLANRLYDLICSDETGIVPTTSARIDENHLPGTVSVMVPWLDSETLVLGLDQLGFEVSAGSACSSGSLDPSHVLSAMEIPREFSLGSLRISFDERVAAYELDRFADALVSLAERNRKR